ncbi:MAG: radical SAM protein, partial [Candidatus Omnitrophica bacterium]|nr:radical SAM protein [Candidatus Omnitrophota bacterium]
MKKQSLILFFGYMCNNRCIFCDSDMRDPVQLKREKAGNNFSAVRIKKIISRLGKKGYSGIEFAGGEPT